MCEANEAASQSDRWVQVIHERAFKKLYRRTLSLQITETGISEAFDRVRDAMRGTIASSSLKGGVGALGGFEETSPTQGGVHEQEVYRPVVG